MRARVQGLCKTTEWDLATEYVRGDMLEPACIRQLLPRRLQCICRGIQPHGAGLAEWERIMTTIIDQSYGYKESATPYKIGYGFMIVTTTRFPRSDGYFHCLTPIAPGRLQDFTYPVYGRVFRS